MIRGIAVAAACLAWPGTALAEPFAEAYSGVVAEIRDSPGWRSSTTWKLGIRAGSSRRAVSYLASVDWTPFDVQSVAHRFRGLAGLQLRYPAGRVTFGGRLAAGVDLLHRYERFPAFGSETMYTAGSDLGIGLAFEAGAGAWLDVGSAALGIELALPVGYHASGAGADDPNDQVFRYTSVELDLLLALRIKLR